MKLSYFYTFCLFYIILGLFDIYLFWFFFYSLFLWFWYSLRNILIFGFFSCRNILSLFYIFFLSEAFFLLGNSDTVVLSLLNLNLSHSLIHLVTGMISCLLNRERRVIFINLIRLNLRTLIFINNGLIEEEISQGALRFKIFLFYFLEVSL